MKSRIAGSLVHILRKAERLSSSGTPARKKGVMSVDSVIESSDGRLARSTGSASGGAAGVSVGGASTFGASGSAGGGSDFAASRLRRDQRVRKSSSLIRAALLGRASPEPRDWHGRVCV